MREPVERAYFGLCRTLGRLLRGARYSAVRIVEENGERRVHKRRRRHAPLLVWLGGPLVRVLDTGVRVLPQREWEARERLLHHRLHGATVRVEPDGVLVLPHLPGATLAALLEDPHQHPGAAARATELAVAALVALHRQGVTHGDAMAENVMVDLEGGVARWFDFETVHDPARPMAWRRADDLRALLTTCLVRTAPAQRAATLRRIVDAYADAEVTRALAARLATVVQRPLAFHLGQAGASYAEFREMARLLCARAGWPNP